MPFFFKQWGGVRKSKTGRQLEGRTYDELPSRAAAPVPPEPRRHELLAQAEQVSAEWLSRVEPAPAQPLGA